MKKHSRFMAIFLAMVLILSPVTPVFAALSVYIDDIWYDEQNDRLVVEGGVVSDVYDEIISPEADKVELNINGPDGLNISDWVYTSPWVDVYSNVYDDVYGGVYDDVYGDVYGDVFERWFKYDLPSPPLGDYSVNVSVYGGGYDEEFINLYCKLAQ